MWFQWKVVILETWIQVVLWQLPPSPARLLGPPLATSLLEMTPFTFDVISGGTFFSIWYNLQPTRNLCNSTNSDLFYKGNWWSLPCEGETCITYSFKSLKASYKRFTCQIANLHCFLKLFKKKEWPSDNFGISSAVFHVCINYKEFCF